MKTFIVPGEELLEEMLNHARESLIEIRADQPFVCADFMQRFIHAADDGNEKINIQVSKDQNTIFMYVRIRESDRLFISDTNARGDGE